MRLRTRFAPSPTGLLHVGNAFSALLCQRWAIENDAELLLRIEDIDHTRCQSRLISSMLEDLKWLGLTWPEPVRQQSKHLGDYRDAIHRLDMMGVIYPCFCTRKSIQQEMERMALAPHSDDISGLYPGTCRNLSHSEKSQRMAASPFAWRLDIKKAMAKVALPLQWHEESGPVQTIDISHDEVIGRKDISFSYHLSVVVDDALQGVTHIIRGKDLRPVTGIHRLLQALLGLPEPTYIHHPLLKTVAGERLAKRNSATTITSLRNMGIKPQKLKSFLLSQPLPLWPFTEENGDANEGEILQLLGNS